MKEALGCKSKQRKKIIIQTYKINQAVRKILTFFLLLFTFHYFVWYVHNHTHLKKIRFANFPKLEEKFPEQFLRNNFMLLANSAIFYLVVRFL